MEEGFELPVIHNGKEIWLPARLLTLGWTYKIEIDINGIPVHFEKDDEGNWRALVVNVSTGYEKTIERELIERIIKAIEHIMQE